LLLTASADGGHNWSFDGARVTNHGGGGTITVRALTNAERSGGGMSNGIDGKGAEAWPKVQHGLHEFKSIMCSVSPNTPEKELAESLFGLLTWVQYPPAWPTSLLESHFPVGSLPRRQEHAQN